MAKRKTEPIDPEHTVKEKTLEYLIDKLLHMFDPIIDPIVDFVRNQFAKLRNWWRIKRGHEYAPGQPIIMTEDEYDAEDEQPVLLIPAT